jgi:hypothetical protein
MNKKRRTSFSETVDSLHTKKTESIESKDEMN